MKWEASLCKSQQTWTQEPMESWIPELWDTPSPPALQASRRHLSWGVVTGTVSNVSTGAGKTPEAHEQEQ